MQRAQLHVCGNTSSQHAQSCRSNTTILQQPAVAGAPLTDIHLFSTNIRAHRSPAAPCAPAMRALASEMPPAGPTLLLAILKSAMPGQRSSSEPMWPAPSSPLMLLNRCRPARRADCGSSSASALQACTEQPTFCSDRNSRPWQVWRQQQGSRKVAGSVSLQERGRVSVTAGRGPGSCHCFHEHHAHNARSAKLKHWGAADLRCPCTYVHASQTRHAHATQYTRNRYYSSNCVADRHTYKT